MNQTVPYCRLQYILQCRESRPYREEPDQRMSILLSSTFCTSCYTFIICTCSAVAHPDISFGGHEAPRLSAVGARIEAPRGVGCGEGVSPSPLEVRSGLCPLPRNFFNFFLLKNCVFCSFLMSKCASHMYTRIAYFHCHQYKPTSYNYILE